MVSGLLVATLLAGDPVAEIIALLASVFGMYYFIMVFYAVGIFCVTVMLGLLYGMLGASLDSILMLRLEETLIGALAAIFVAVFILPTRTRDQVIRSGRGVLGGLAGCVRACREALAGSATASPIAAVRQMDRQVADLRLALAPLTARRRLFRRSSLERPIPALLECVRWVRILAGLCQMPLASEQQAVLVDRVRAIEIRLCALAGMKPDGSVDPAIPSAAELPEPVAETAIADAIAHLDAAVSIVAERLRLGAMEGFALDA